uniref:Uncharacterized protein n=1 Tax=Aegilops tauschii TaxID=37682 RepID=M8BKJ4_AEGTA
MARLSTLAYIQSPNSDGTQGFLYAEVSFSRTIILMTTMMSWRRVTILPPPGSSWLHCNQRGLVNSLMPLNLYGLSLLKMDSFVQNKPYFSRVFEESINEWKSQVSACSSSPLALISGWQFKVLISITLCDTSFGFPLMNYLFTLRCDWSLTVRTDKVHTEDDEGMG